MDNMTGVRYQDFRDDLLKEIEIILNYDCYIPCSKYVQLTVYDKHNKVLEAWDGENYIKVETNKLMAYVFNTIKRYYLRLDLLYNEVLCRYHLANIAISTLDMECGVLDLIALNDDEKRDTVKAEFHDLDALSYVSALCLNDDRLRRGVITNSVFGRPFPVDLTCKALRHKKYLKNQSAYKEILSKYGSVTDEQISNYKLIYADEIVVYGQNARIKINENKHGELLKQLNREYIHTSICPMPDQIIYRPEGKRGLVSFAGSSLNFIRKMYILVYEDTDAKEVDLNEAFSEEFSGDSQNIAAGVMNIVWEDEEESIITVTADMEDAQKKYIKLKKDEYLNPILNNKTVVAQFDPKNDCQLEYLYVEWDEEIANACLSMCSFIKGEPFYYNVKNGFGFWFYEMFSSCDETFIGCEDYIDRISADIGNITDKCGPEYRKDFDDKCFEDYTDNEEHSIFYFGCETDKDREEIRSSYFSESKRLKDEKGKRLKVKKYEGHLKFPKGESRPYVDIEGEVLPVKNLPRLYRPYMFHEHRFRGVINDGCFIVDPDCYWINVYDHPEATILDRGYDEHKKTFENAVLVKQTYEYDPVHERYLQKIVLMVDEEEKTYYSFEPVFMHSMEKKLIMRIRGLIYKHPKYKDKREYISVFSISVLTDKRLEDACNKYGYGNISLLHLLASPVEIDIFMASNTYCLAEKKKRDGK